MTTLIRQGKDTLSAGALILLQEGRVLKLEKREGMKLDVLETSKECKVRSMSGAY